VERVAVTEVTELERLRADLDDLAEQLAESREAAARAEVAAEEAEARESVALITRSINSFSAANLASSGWVVA